MRILVPIALIAFLTACTGDSNENQIQESIAAPEQLFTSLTANELGIGFLNQITENEDINHMVWDACYYGGGVALGDVNNDGLLDVFFTGNQVNDALYLNRGDWNFEDVSEDSGINTANGWSTGAAMVDFNGDGWLDIYVCRSGWTSDNEMVDERRNVLWKNNGDGTFSNVAATLGLDNQGFSTQSAWLDYDGDGDLDMFLLNAPSNFIPQKVKYNAEGFPDFVSDKLFRNDGDKFTDVSAEAGVAAISFGLGVVVADMNHDGYTDIYVANDYERPDYFYINKGNGTFGNELNSKVKHTCFTAMGVDAGDVNNDALLDFAVLDMQASDHYRSKTNMPSMRPDQFWKWVNQGYNYQYMTNTLQINNGVGFFSDVCQLAGIASTDWSWSVLVNDFDLDGWKDIYVTNGINRDIQNNDFANAFEERMKRGEKMDLLEIAAEAPSTKIPNFAFRNKGGLRFDKASPDWGLNDPSFSYGAAIGDLDGDGDQDLIVNNNNMAPFIYRNESTSNWIRIKVDGDSGNTNGIGSKVAIFTNGNKQFHEITAVRGYQSSSEPVATFGLGDNTSIDSLVVFLPNGKRVKRKKQDANQEIAIAFSEGGNPGYNLYGEIKPRLREVTAQTGLKFNHTEDNFDDFEREILLPHRQSRLGPAIAVGDLNGDGLEDVFFGGAAGQAGMVMIQKNDGSFSEVSAPFAKKSLMSCEEVAATMLDIDGDGDLDIYSVVGGSHLSPGHPEYRDILYTNEGNSSFAAKRIEGTNYNGSAVAAYDFDADGDDDLFVGAKGIPGQYPRADHSVLLINDGGNLVEKTAELAPALDTLGMVTRAIWSDFDGDNKKDLVIVGEWMSPMIFSNDGATLSPASVNESLIDHTGWYYEVEEVDIDVDGDLDYVVGNVGLNNKFHPSLEKPLKVYGNDFDHNSTNDVVLAKCSKDKYVPVRGRECSSEQMPFVAKKFEDYNSFASATLEDIYGEGLEEAIKLQVNDFQSGILVNEGGSFRFVALPDMAQISAIHGVVAEDVNNDGIVDLIIAGNLYGAEVETMRYDASNGLLLLGRGNYEFDTQNALYSGFYAPGDVKQLEQIKLANGSQAVIIGNNNQSSLVFSW